LEVVGDKEIRIYGLAGAAETNTYIIANVRNGIAYLTGWLITTAETSDNTLTIANIPEGARPKSATYLNCLFRPAGLDGGAADIGIATNGNITVNDVYTYRSDVGSFGPGARIYFSGISYPVT
jgi:hypothetical protein